MIIDIIFAVLLLTAVIKGYQRGFIVAVFSVIALMAGLAAAIKLSALAAVYLRDAVNVSVRWLPVLSFVLVFLAAVLLVRLGAKAIEKMVAFAMLGWLNRLFGMLLYVLVYTIILSVVLFYVEKVHLLPAEVATTSATYRFIAPWGARTIQAIAAVLPFFGNVFHDLESFFGNMAAEKQVVLTGFRFINRR